MHCQRCGKELAIDGGCEACWIQNMRTMAPSMARADREFLDELHRRYVAFADTVFDLTGIYPSFKEYDDLWWAENKRGSV